MNRRPALFAVVLIAVSLSANAQLTGPTNQILIPAAGDITGANGTHFRSDITVTNFGDAEQRVMFVWIPGEVPLKIDPPPPYAVVITMPPHSFIASEDFMAAHLTPLAPFWHLGALLVRGVTSSDQIDPAALLQATERIWTAQPGTSGTTSQSVQVVDANRIPGGKQAVIFGHHIDTRYRTNVGVVNLDKTATRTFDIYQTTDDPTLAAVVTTVVLAPMTMRQVALQEARARALQVTVVLRPDVDASAPWLAYASSVDNVTGDSWSNVALPR